MFNLRLIVLVYRKGDSLIVKASSSWAVECSNHSDLKIYTLHLLTLSFLALAYATQVI